MDKLYFYEQEILILEEYQERKGGKKREKEFNNCKQSR